MNVDDTFYPQSIALQARLSAVEAERDALRADRDRNWRDFPTCPCGDPNHGSQCKRE